MSRPHRAEPVRSGRSATPAKDTRHILVVDDEPDVGRMLETYLGGEGFRVTAVTDGAAMRRVVAEQPVDLVILDLVLPGEDGFEIARRLRAESNLPIVMLTGRRELMDRITGLELGADDYLTKPFSLRELLARVRSVLRRHKVGGAGAEAPATARFAGWALDTYARELCAPDGDRVPLTSAEFRLLGALIATPRRAVDRDRLTVAVSQREWTPYDRSIDVLVGKLRQKMEADPRRPRLIKTERGVGYLLAAEVAWS